MGVHRARPRWLDWMWAIVAGILIGIEILAAALLILLVIYLGKAM